MSSVRRQLSLALVLLLMGGQLAEARAPAPREPEPLPLEPEPLPLEPEPAPLAPEDPGGDVVEVIDAGPPGPSDASAAPAAPVRLGAPPVPDSFQFTGWARGRLSVGLTDSGAAEDDLAPVPYSRLHGQAQLHLRLRYARGRRFEAVASGLLGASLFDGDLSSTYETTLREAQVGFFFKRFDLRVGQQRIPWGRGDAFTPNDVINAYDLRDQQLVENEVLRVPTFALRGDLALGPVSLTGVVAPFFQSNKFDVYGGNWGILQPDAPLAYRVLANQNRTTVDAQLYPSMAQDFSSTSAGLRVALALRGVDLDAFYHYGYDPTPALSVSDAGSFSAAYQRRHHAGLSAAAPLGRFVLRGDFAADTQTVVLGSDLQGVVLPSVQGVLGLEYQSGELGKALVLEAHYQYLIDLPADRALLFQREHNASVAALVRWSFLRDRLQLELRALAGLAPLSYLLRPQVAFKHHNLELRLGATVLGGGDATFGNYYRRNMQIYTMAKYSF